MEQRGLSQQAPREGLCARSARLFCSGEQAARVILDDSARPSP
jgi:hypothetical protein